MEEYIKEIINGKSNKIVQDIEFLSVPCTNVDVIEEGEEIASKLFRVLTERNDGIGLAANQIGIQKRVVVINVKEPIYLINPVIKEAEGELIYSETCLSFPNKEVRTKRFSSIFVTSDNYPDGLYCDVSDVPLDKNFWKNLDVLECVALQHELSHIDGKTMFDFEYKPKPIINTDKKYERNDKIVITNDVDTKHIKYKNFHEFYEKGYRILED